jgi:BNR repeat-containing family member
MTIRVTKKSLTGIFLLAAFAAACSSEQSTPTNSGGAGGKGAGGSGGGPVTGGTGGSMSSGTGGSVNGGTGGSVSTGGSGQQAGSGGHGGTPIAAGSGGTGAGVGGGTAGMGGGGTSGAPAVGGAGGVVATGGNAAGGMGAGGAAGMGAGGAVACTVPTGAPTEKLVTFNDNGGWCWYQDERVLVDTTNNRLVVGSIASGGSRNGNTEAVVYDLAAKTGKTTVLNNLSVDDHNAPAFAITGTGTIAAVWATHRLNCNTYFSTLSGSTWSATKTYDWTPQGCPWPGADTNMITYANPWLMSSESNRLYSAVRSVDTSPGVLSSSDNGGSWSYYGRLTASPQTGYVAGYYKYWGNGVDRIDWVGTEAHPRDDDNSLWHGYIQGGKVYDSLGNVVDSTLGDGTAQDVSKYTQVFKTGTTINGVVLNHMWNHDIVRYADGTIAVLGQGRVNGTGTDDPDKRIIYSRFDGKSWTTTYLVKGGHKLYADEQDYIGLSALDPDNPTIIYVSTPYDPRDDTTMSAKHEIWQGTTCDNGKTFSWTPVTQNSTADNIRPVVPKWDASHTALLWMQGTYTSAQSYNMKIVGLVMGN